MKRRTFIRLVGASALGLPFMNSHFGEGARAGVSAALRAARSERVPLKLELEPDEASIIDVLRRRSPGVYLAGGGVLAKAAGSDLPYLNLVVHARKFAESKKDLFKHGVTPVSTPMLPSSFIRFTYQDRAYSVVNLGLDDYVKQNILSDRPKLVPLAHNFLLYDTLEQWALDPYDALAEKAGRGKHYRAKILQDPASAAMGFELCLAALFDSALLNLELPAGYARFEQRVLGAKAETQAEADYLFRQVLNYFPDVLELRGWDCTRKFLTSPLLVSAGARGPGIDLHRVESGLSAAAAKGKEITGALILGRIQEEFRRAERTPGLGIGLPDYMASQRAMARRTDVMAQVMSEPKTATA